MPKFHQLVYHSAYWILHETCTKQYQYEQMTLTFDGGIFLLMKLTGISGKRTLVVFYDQISAEQHRVLKIVHYLHKKF